MQLLVEPDKLPREKVDAFAAMVGFRNRAVHLYADIDPAEVWAIVESDLDDFEVFIRAITSEYFQSAR